MESCNSTVRKQYISLRYWNNITCSASQTCATIQQTHCCVVAHTIERVYLFSLHATCPCIFSIMVSLHTFMWNVQLLIHIILLHNMPRCNVPGGAFSLMHPFTEEIAEGYSVHSCNISSQLSTSLKWKKKKKKKPCLSILIMYVVSLATHPS